LRDNGENSDSLSISIYAVWKSMTMPFSFRIIIPWELSAWLHYTSVWVLGSNDFSDSFVLTFYFFLFFCISNFMLFEQWKCIIGSQQHCWVYKLAEYPPSAQVLPTGGATKSEWQEAFRRHVLFKSIFILAEQKHRQAYTHTHIYTWDCWRRTVKQDKFIPNTFSLEKQFQVNKSSQ
jgi:hypothetical protein